MIGDFLIEASEDASNFSYYEVMFEYFKVYSFIVGVGAVPLLHPLPTPIKNTHKCSSCKEAN